MPDSPFVTIVPKIFFYVLASVLTEKMVAKLGS
jgi:hypothetical protein